MVRKRKKQKKIRPYGQIWLDLEPLIMEMFEDHDIQHGDLLGQLDCYLRAHLPGFREVYLDGTTPVLKYGPNNE
jgi:hypothetical protein